MHNLLQAGLFFFGAGRYFEAHEAWEDLWRDTPPGPLRLFYQGLIQGAVGLHHLNQGNLTGARSQLRKALDKLEAGRPDGCPLDPAEIVEGLRKALETLEVPPIGSSPIQ